MVRYLFFLIVFIVFVPNTELLAKEEINYKSIEDAGFTEVSKILQKMSPEQLKEVVKQAESMLHELKNITQQELDAFTQKLLSMESALDASKINVQNLEPQKSKNLEDIKNDIDTHIKNQGLK